MYALITGASSGLGKEIAYILSKEGYDLILVARRENKLIEIKNHLELNGSHVIIEAVDLSIYDNCISLFEKVKQYQINLFINNAGFGLVGLFENTDLDTELSMINLNVITLQILTKLYIQNFSKGTVVNIGSLAGYLPTPNLSVYAASKAYVHNFSRAVDYELRKNKRNVRVLTVMPGPVKTEFNNIAKSKINRGMEANKCANIIVKGIKKQKSTIIPGFSNKILSILIKFIPVKILLRAAYNIQRKK
ncbi:MAG: SDR family oxidoreductase [Tenericutes bacterium]|nr:SDR family oxidoreductase [Mycoplasmatota bacterium]